MGGMQRFAPPSEPRARGGASPLLDRVVLAVALLYTLAYAVVALLRMPYPFELEWMEGGMLTQVQRVLHGQPIYTAPSLSYIPFDYTPLYFMVAAVPARWMGEGFTALRLLSFVASLGCFALIFALVWRQTASGSAAVIATGLFAATYRLSGAWFDIARPDSLFLLLLLAGILALRGGRAGWRGAALSGALFALAFLAKQTALIVAVPLALHALFTDRRRFAAFAGGLAALVAGSTLLLNLRSGGWYGYYVFGVAAGHSIDPGLVVRFWIQDLLTPLALATVAGAAFLLLPAPEGRPRARGFHAAVVAGLAGSAWWLRMFRGSYDNALMPAYAGVALLAGFGWDAWRGHFATTAPGEQGSNPDAGGRRGAARLIAIGALAQFALLAWNPADQLPTRADRRAGAGLVENLRRVPGEVLVPSHPYLAVRAGKPDHFHEVALTDVLARRGHGALERALSDSLEAAFRDHRWATLVLDTRDWLRAGAEPYYAPLGSAFDSDTVFWSRTGMLTRPQVVLGPKP
jgi:hypothetical protein